MTAPKRDWLLEAKERCAPDWRPDSHPHDRNADLASHARTDIPRAIAALEAADRLVELLDRCQDDCCLQCEAIKAYLAARHGDSR